MIYFDQGHKMTETRRLQRQFVPDRCVTEQKVGNTLARDDSSKERIVVQGTEHQTFFVGGHVISSFQP